MKNIFLRDGLGRISTLSKNSAGTNINNLNILQRSNIPKSLNISKLKCITKIQIYPKV